MTSEWLYNTWNYLQDTRIRLVCGRFEPTQQQITFSKNKNLDISFRSFLSSHLCFQNKVKFMWLVSSPLDFSRSPREGVQGTQYKCCDIPVPGLTWTLQFFELWCWQASKGFTVRAALLDSHAQRALTSGAWGTHQAGDQFTDFTASNKWERVGLGQQEKGRKNHKAITILHNWHIGKLLWKVSGTVMEDRLRQRYPTNQANSKVCSSEGSCWLCWINKLTMKPCWAAVMKSNASTSMPAAGHIEVFLLHSAEGSLSWSTKLGFEHHAWRPVWANLGA